MGILLLAGRAAGAVNAILRTAQTAGRLWRERKRAKKSTSAKEAKS